MSVQIVTFIGGNLFEIAATQLGSAVQWINIARVNSISDPMLSGQTTLIIPAFSDQLADGIGPQ